MRRPNPELTPDQLKALTHPLRLAILRVLRSDGPATATALAQRLAESSGATSYHLRQLARHGFVEDDPDRGDGRDRWWRPAFTGHRVEVGKWLADPEARAVVTTYEAEVVRDAAEQAVEFLAEQGAGRWSREWVDATDFSSFRFRLTPAQLLRLVEALHEVAESFPDAGAPPEPGSEPVLLQIQAFPRPAQPFAAES